MNLLRRYSTKIDWDSTLNLPKTTMPMKSGMIDDEFREVIGDKLYNKISSNDRKLHFNLIDGPPFSNGDLHVGKG